MLVEEIKHLNKTLAMLIYKDTTREEVHFFTPDTNLLQVGKHSHKKGKLIKPHLHCDVRVDNTGPLQEVLYIEKGKVKVKFFTPRGKLIDTKILSEGDIMLLIEGGHGFEFLEKTKMVEIKQGPYNPASRKSLKVKE